MTLFSYQEEYLSKPRRKKQNRKLAVILISAVLFASSVVSIKSCEESRRPEPATMKSHTTLTDKEWKMSRYFAKKGSKSPDEMAVAVLATKSPRIMARIAVVETNGNPHIRKYGYKKRHDGAFGVSRRDWGNVSHKALEQAFQAEDALETFVKESKNNLVKGLNNYGGDKSKKTYAQLILNDLHEVPK